MTTDLIADYAGAALHLSLNRPQAIHALTHDMVRAMTAALVDVESSFEQSVVMIDHKDGRGFCSGGDISLLRASALGDGGVSGRAFFFDEYRLNHKLFTYALPVVAFMDGITMGGGVGISAPARYRVATENTRFAMPETGIGLLPDVGGGWHLSRLPGRIGHFLALTGARFDAAECLWAGLATHYLPAEALAEAKARMKAGEAPGPVLDGLSVAPPEPRVAANVDLINRHFASDRLEDILASLAADPGEWAAKELATLKTKSPQAMKVALRQLAEAAKLDDFADNMAMEYRLASRMLTLPDFAEGVRAVIVDKTNDARWNPATPEDVSEAAIDAIFAPLPEGEEWEPLH